MFRLCRPLLILDSRSWRRRAVAVLGPWRSEVTEIPYVPQPIEFPARYAHGPASFVQPSVPRGALHEYEWNESRVFPETRRRYWAYVPARYTSAEPASLMVFQDAEWYMDLDFEVRAPIVIDNLIHKGEMPVTIVVFVEPSVNRNAEYDAFSDAYATFLLEEIIPAIRAEWAITEDPALPAPPRGRSTRRTGGCGPPWPWRGRAPGWWRPGPARPARP